MSDDLRLSLESQTFEALRDPRSTHALITLALTEPDEHKAWESVRVLHFRGTKEVFDDACSLCVSDCSVERKLGADILGQLGIPDRSFADESVAFLLRLLADEHDQEVLAAICIALAHIHDPKAIPALAELKNHPNADVRFGVARGLTFEDDLAIKTLIGLMKDRESDLRDWATFGLGTQVSADTPEIREALFSNLSDTDPDTRGEAMVGLARRKDPRIIKPLIAELARLPESELGGYCLDAALELGDGQLLPSLLNLKRSGQCTDRRLDDAIERCFQIMSPT